MHAAKVCNKINKPYIQRKILRRFFCIGLFYYLPAVWSPALGKLTAIYWLHSMYYHSPLFTTINKLRLTCSRLQKIIAVLWNHITKWDGSLPRCSWTTFTRIIYPITAWAKLPGGCISSGVKSSTGQNRSMRERRRRSVKATRRKRATRWFHL